MKKSKKDKITGLKNSTNPKKYMIITVKENRILIEDFSGEGARYKLVELLEKAGIKTKIDFDSWCG